MADHDQRFKVLQQEFFAEALVRTRRPQGSWAARAGAREGGLRRVVEGAGSAGSVLHDGRRRDAVGAGCAPQVIASAKLVQHRRGLAPVRRIKAFGKPAIDLGQKRAGSVPLVLLLPEPTQAQRRSQL